MNAKKKLLIIIALVAITVVVSNSVVHRIFYNPRRSFHDHSNTTQTTFITLTMLLSPTVTESAIMPYGNRFPPGIPTFSFHRLGFRFLRESFVQNRYDELEAMGIFDIRFGRAFLRDYEDGLKLGELTITQSLFLSSYASQDYWAAISDEQSYIVWLSFVEPMDRDSLVEQFYVFFGPDHSERQLGISWLAIKTSDNPEDICFGIGGNLNAQNGQLHDRYWGWQPDQWVQESEILFKDSLRFLIENQAATDTFISTGLWTNAEMIDFTERLAFIEENGIQYLGFVGYICGENLRALESEELSIVRLVEDT